MGQQNKALSDYCKAIQLKPNYAEAYNNRAVLYADMGQEEEALPPTTTVQSY